jgi:glyoxylase-like metal-dependent hydrolase (beta-lactamase superfamily II)
MNDGFDGRDVEGDLEDLGSGVYKLPTDYPEVCNAPLWSYLITEDDHFALVDPGVASTMQASLAPAVTHLGLRLENVDLVVATHGHPDHSGGQFSWQHAAASVTIAAPLVETPWIESFDRQWVEFWDDYPGTMDLTSERHSYEELCTPEPSVDLLLRDGDAFGVGGRSIDVIETRGHTWGHCAYYDGRSGALFTGDAVQGRGTRSSDGDSVFAPMYVDVTDARWGLRRLLDRPFTWLCPAHASPLQHDDGVALIHQSLEFIDEMDRLTRDYVIERGGGPLTTRGLAERIGETVGTKPPVSPQSVVTARAHLYALAREGVLEAAWLPKSAHTHASSH